MNSSEEIVPAGLPDDWDWSTLGEISSKPQYGWTTKANHESGKIKLLRTTDITSGELNWNSVPYCTEVPDDLEKYQVKEGDIFISRAGSVGFSYLLKTAEPAVFASYLIRFRFDGDINRKYVYYFLKSPSYWLAIGDSASGIAVPNVNATKLAAISIPIAPRDQQDRIVAEIEKQFSRLDETVASLKRVKANLKRYKAAVLKAAVEGKLTEKWRKQNPDVEPASKLLERILAARRTKWEEAELAKMKAKGKEPKDDKWKAKYKPAISLDHNETVTLPSTWAWVTWDELLAFDEGAFRRGPFGSALKKSIFVPKGYKVYEQYCPINDDPHFARYFITKEKYIEMEKFAVQERDFLISCSGVTLGRITQIPGDYKPGVINQALLRVRLNYSVISDVYFLTLFRSPYFQGKIFDNAQGAAIPNVKGVKQLKSIPVPLPPLEEQCELIRLVETYTSVHLALENQLATTMRRLDRLKQSVLSSAFSISSG